MIKNYHFFIFISLVLPFLTAVLESIILFLKKFIIEDI